MSVHGRARLRTVGDVYGVGARSYAKLFQSVRTSMWRVTYVHVTEILFVKQPIKVFQTLHLGTSRWPWKFSGLFLTKPCKLFQ